MGVKFLILLALVIGVLYSLHLLARDFQAITAPRLLRLLFKRDVSSHNYSKPNVRWRKILQYDPIQCAQYLFCDTGVRAPDNEIRRGFIFMLTLEPREEDRPAQEEFKKAYMIGKSGEDHCKRAYRLCPFQAPLLFELMQYLLRKQ